MYYLNKVLTCFNITCILVLEVKKKEVNKWLSTTKSCVVESKSFAKPSRKTIKKCGNGNEQIKIDEYRSLSAGKTDL